MWAAELAELSVSLMAVQMVELLVVQRAALAGL